MKIIERQSDNYTIKIMIIDYRFNNFPNIICSGGKIYQLPCQIGKKSYKLKELSKKYHLGSTVSLIESKRINTKNLKNNAIKTNEEFILEKIKFCPF